MKNADTANEIRMSRIQRTNTRRVFRPDDPLLALMGCAVVPADEALTVWKSLSGVEVINRCSTLSHYIEPSLRVALSHPACNASLRHANMTPG